MLSDKDKRLNKLLKNVEADKPAPEFLDLVMKQVRVEAQNELISNAKLRSLLKANPVESPSTDFTQILMEQIASIDNQAARDTVMGRKVWHAIGATLIVLLLVIAFSENPAPSSQTAPPLFEEIGSSLTMIITQINTIPSLYLLIVISMGVLLTLDYIIRNKFVQKQHFTS